MRVCAHVRAWSFFWGGGSVMDALIFRADRRHEPLLLPRHALTLQNKTATLNKPDGSSLYTEAQQ